ncbi:hypothetical protein Esti_002966 [Eimeria stiedai]
MDDGDRDKVKSVAAALLKDENFTIKYPALARALQQSVDPLENWRASQKPQAALSQPNGSLQAASPPTSAPNFPNGGTPAAPASTPSQQTDEPRTPVPADVKLASTVLPHSDGSANGSGLVERPSVYPHGRASEAVGSKGSTEQTFGNASSDGSQTATQAVDKPLDPPLHYVKRWVSPVRAARLAMDVDQMLEQLQQGYMQIMQQRNSVELQYHLLRKTGRQLWGATPTGPLALSPSPPFMLPSTSARPLAPHPADEWQQGTREQQEQQQAIMQLQRTASPVVPSFGGAPPWQAQWMRPVGVPPVAPLSGDLAPAERLATVQWLHQHVHPEKPRPTVDPAVLYEKTGMDLAVQHFKDQAERMHAQSREITRAILQKQQQAEIEALRTKNAHPLLTEVTAEQQRLIEEQLRCIDEASPRAARGDIAVAQAEADRIERRSRDAFYHAAYSENADPELVRLHAERMKEITKIQGENPLPNQSGTTRAVAEGLDDPLEVMADRNVDFREQRLSAAAAQLAVSRMLRNLGYQQDSEDGVLVHRGDGPAVCKSKFPGVYPKLSYANALPVSQQGRRELYDSVQQDAGQLRTFADYVKEEHEKHAGSAAVLREEDRQLMHQQQEMREEDDDWARVCLSKLLSKNLALEEAHEAKLQVEQAQRNLEAMRHQLLAERSEFAELARKHEEAQARAAEAERQVELTRRSAEAPKASRSPSRSATLTVEAAAEGVPRHGASLVGRSRTLSRSRTSLSQEPLKSERSEHLRKTIQDSFDVAAPKRLHTAIPQQGRRKGELLSNALAERLPPYRCEEFVFLSPPVEATPAKLKFLYGQLKKVFSAGERCIIAKACPCHFSVLPTVPLASDDLCSSEAEYANALIQALPYYPYQIDIQRAGIIGLLNIFESSKSQEHLAPPIFETLTTLMAIDDKELRSDIIAVMAAVVRPKVVINTDLVDLLLQQVDESSDCEVVTFCIHILIVARSPHKKAAQYSLFLKVLGKWKHETSVLTRACLAIDAAAHRAQLEGLATHERRKRGGDGQRGEGHGNLRRSPSYLEEAQVMDATTPKWMPDDSGDVDKVLEVMQSHANNRKLQGAACQAIASLARASLGHCRHVARTAFPLLTSALSTHPESQSVASGFASTISIVGRVKECKVYLRESMLEEVNSAIQRHRSVPEVVSSCCAALTALENFYSPQIEVFSRVTLHIIISSLRDSRGAIILSTNVNEFIATFSYHVDTLADARRRAVELGVIEAIIKSMTSCSSDPLVCAYGCRAISRLVYKEPSDSKIYTELTRTRAMTTFLFVMFKHYAEPCLAEDALRCTANCAANEVCASVILERGLNVICKVVGAHCDNMEVVAQGCRCLWLLSSQPGLQQMAVNRGVLLIEHAAEKYSVSSDAKRLVSEFLLRILKGDGVARQSIKPLWDTSLEGVQGPSRPPKSPGVVERQTLAGETSSLARKMTAAGSTPLSARGVNPLHL